MRLGRAAGALQERAFRLLFFGRAFSLFGDGLLPVALAFAVLSVSNSASALGFVMAARTVPLVGLVLVGGVWGDRLPRQHVMLTSDLIRFVTQGLAAVLLITGNAHLWHLLVLMFVYGAAAAFFMPASTGLVPQTVSPSRLQQANALLGLTQSSFSIAGPAAAGALVATVGPGWAFAGDSASFIVSAAFLSQLRISGLVAERATPFLHELRAGWREVKARTWVLADGVLAALGNAMVLAPLWALGPLVSKRSLGGAGAWALIVTSFGIGAILGSATVLRLKPRRPLLVGWTALSAFIVPPALLAVPTPAIAVAAGTLAAGFALSLANTLFETTLQQHVPAEAQARAMSFVWLLALALQPIGFTLVGPVSNLIGVSATLAAAAAVEVIFVAIALSVPSIRSVERLEAEPEPPLAAAEAPPLT